MGLERSDKPIYRKSSLLFIDNIKQISISHNTNIMEIKNNLCKHTYINNIKQ